MAGWRAFAFWSPMLGCDAVRLSMVDAHGGEFWRVIPVEPGYGVDKDGKRVSKHQLNRDAALDEIEDAIAAGVEPGEVRDGEAD